MYRVSTICILGLALLSYVSALSCLDQKNQSVEWSVALYPPQSKCEGYLYLDSNHSSSTFERYYRHDLPLDPFDPVFNTIRQVDELMPTVKYAIWDPITANGYKKQSGANRVILFLDEATNTSILISHSLNGLADFSFFNKLEAEFLEKKSASILQQSFINTRTLPSSLSFSSLLKQLISSSHDDSEHYFCMSLPASRLREVIIKSAITRPQILISTLTPPLPLVSSTEFLYSSFDLGSSKIRILYKSDFESKPLLSGLTNMLKTDLLVNDKLIRKNESYQFQTYGYISSRDRYGYYNQTRYGITDSSDPICVNASYPANTFNNDSSLNNTSQDNKAYAHTTPTTSTSSPVIPVNTTVNPHPHSHNSTFSNGSLPSNNLSSNNVIINHTVTSPYLWNIESVSKLKYSEGCQWQAANKDPSHIRSSFRAALWRNATKWLITKDTNFTCFGDLEMIDQYSLDVGGSYYCLQDARLHAAMKSLISETKACPK